MGEAKRRATRTQRLLANHPMCCFCGGSVPATTTEHAPPIVFFVDRLRPKGHEFPACARCNLGSKHQDTVAAFASLMMAGTTAEVSQHYVDRLISSVRNNYPDVIKGMDSEGEILVRKNGLLHPATAVRVSSSVYETWLFPWAAKQGLALWYLHAETSFPTEGRIYTRWFSNKEVWNRELPEESWEFLPHVGLLSAGKNSSSGQFDYKFGVALEKAAAVFMVVLHSCSVIALVLDKSGDLQLKPKGWIEYATSPERGLCRQ